MTRTTLLRAGVLLLAIAAAAVMDMRMASAQDAPAWINQDANWTANKQKMQAFGERFKTSEALYDALKHAAGGGKPPGWQQMAEPPYDWSGIYTRTRGGLQFDPDLPPDAGPDSAKLTPAGQQAVKTKADLIARTGGE